MAYGDKSLSFFFGLSLNPHNCFLYKYCRQASVLLRIVLFSFFHFLSCLLSYLSKSAADLQASDSGGKYLVVLFRSFTVTQAFTWNPVASFSIFNWKTCISSSWISHQYWNNSANWVLSCSKNFLYLKSFVFFSSHVRISYHNWWLVDLERQEKGSRWSKNQLSVVWFFFLAWKLRGKIKKFDAGERTSKKLSKRLILINASFW